MNSPDCTPTRPPVKITIIDILKWLIEWAREQPPQEPAPMIREERGDGFVKITVRLNHS